MCGGFTCSKNALIALNILYIVVAFILITVAVYGKSASHVTDLPIVGGILACGIFLLLISLAGLMGAIKHHQVLLFFYMVILFLLFLVQFSVACACLAVNVEQRQQLAEQGWMHVSNDTKDTVQRNFQCCGFNNLTNTANSSLNHPPCHNVPACCDNAPDPDNCCTGEIDSYCNCALCAAKLEDKISYAFHLSGGIGLFFSFTEFIGVWLTVRYRNQKDPHANPSAFL